VPTTIARAERVVALDRFVAFAGHPDGIDVCDLDPLTVLLVRTRNSVYRITLLGRRSAMVQGGQFFPEPVRAEITGATLGGSFVKIGWISAGLCLELAAGGQRIVTTRVRTIAVGAPGGLAG
jgi:hypothetical protein